MPTIGEILSDIDNSRLPNIFTNDQKLYWANEVMKQIFKYMNYTDMYYIYTNANKAVYPLASDCVIDELKTVEISNITMNPTETIEYDNITFIRYIFKGVNDTRNLTNFYYDAYYGQFGIYPVPKEDYYLINTIYDKKPTLLRSDDLSFVPEINEHYHPLLTYYICAQLALSGNNPDTELGNNYLAQYNNLLLQMFKDKTETEVKTPTQVRYNKWWNPR